MNTQSLPRQLKKVFELCSSYELLLTYSSLALHLKILLVTKVAQLHVIASDMVLLGGDVYPIITYRILYCRCQQQLSKQTIPDLTILQMLILQAIMPCKK